MVELSVLDDAPLDPEEALLERLGERDMDRRAAVIGVVTLAVGVCCELLTHFGLLS